MNRTLPSLQAPPPPQHYHRHPQQQTPPSRRPLLFAPTASSLTMKPSSGDDDDKSIRFRPGPLFAQERDELLGLAREQFAMLFDVVQLARASQTLNTASVTTIGKTTRATASACRRIHATLREVRAIHFSEHTPFATGFAQTQQLHALCAPSTKHGMRSAALRWALWEAPSKMIRQRDVLYVEYMDEFVATNGRRGWARCTFSIEHRACPPLQSSHNVVRAHLYCSGSVYTETEDAEVLDVVTLCDVDTRGLPTWLSKMLAVRKAESASNVEHLIRLSRVMSDEDDPEVRLIEFHVKGKTCRGCGDKLSTWASSRKCYDCKANICKRCSEVVYFAAEQRQKLTNVCIYCVDNVISAAEHRASDPIPGQDGFNDYVPGTRRMHHMNFRSLRMARETNFSLSPTASEDVSRPSFARDEHMTERGMLRIESDSGVLMRRALVNERAVVVPMPQLRRGKTIAI